MRWPRQALRLAAVHRQDPDLGLLPVGIVAIGEEGDGVAGGVPGDAGLARIPVGQLPTDAALDVDEPQVGHHPVFGRLMPRGEIGDPTPVGREGRVPDIDHVQ